MADIYLVITDDRHADPEVTPFADEAGALAFAEQEVERNARHPGSIELADRELNDAMRNDGWLWYCRYSTEGDSVRVVRRELRKPETAAEAEAIPDPQP
jgi:hypothetical protein